MSQWKKNHEERIEIQTRYPEDIHKSTVLLFSVNIGERATPINPEAYRNAMFPKFPADEKEIGIARDDFNGHSDMEYWQAFAGDIRQKIKWSFDEGIDGKKIKHLSVFAIGPMPLLMYLGKCIGDTVKCYRLFRPKFSKVKTSFFAQIPQVSNTLTPSEGVCDYTPV